MIRSATILLAAAPLIVVGCTVGPDFKEPKPAAPQAWAGMDSSSGPTITSTPSGAPADIAAWWLQFNDPALTSLIERAADGNLGLAQAQTRIRQARAARSVAASGLYPTLDVGASASRSRGASNAGDRIFASTRNSFRDGFDASWELDIFGGVRRGVEAADAQVLSAIYDRHSLLVSLTGEVATNYLELRGAQEQLAIARQNLAAQQQTLDLTQDRFNAGYVSMLDVANAQAIVTQTASQIPLYDTQARTAIYALSVLLGQEPGALLAELSVDAPAPKPPADVPIGLPSELLRRRPDIRKAEADMHAANARIGVAVAAQYPSFSLTGSVGMAGSRFESLGTLASRFWSIGPSVNLPIFSGGRIEGNIEQAKAAAEESELVYKSTILTALQEVETALVSFTREQQRREALTQAAAANRQAVDLALDLYSGGRTDFLNVLTSQRQLYATEAALAQSRTNIGADLVSLYKALGGGWRPPEAVTPAPAPSSADVPAPTPQGGAETPK